MDITEPDSVMASSAVILGLHRRAPTEFSAAGSLLPSTLLMALMKNYVFQTFPWNVNSGGHPDLI